MTVTGFLRRLPLALAAALAIWILARPFFDAATSAMAETLLRAWEKPRVTRLVVVDQRAEVHRSDLRADSRIPTVALSEVHANTILLLALFLALYRRPVRIWLDRLLLGWIVLLVSQVINLAVHVRYLEASALGPWSLDRYSDTGRVVLGYLQLITDLPVRLALPFVLWVALNWADVSEMLGRESVGS